MGVNSLMAGRETAKKDNESPLDGNPFRNLWCKVIHSAVDEYQKRGRTWFFTSDESNFKWICRELGFDADTIRHEVIGGDYETL